MAAWVDLATLHNPTAGTRPPASWGDGLVANLDFLSGSAAAEVNTSQGTASASFADLTTVGPVVTVDTGASALVLLQTYMANSVATAFAAMGVAVSGASSVAASLDDAIFYQAYGAGAQLQHGGFVLLTGLTPGVNVFTAKYLAAGGGTATFQRRQMAVIPLR